MHKSEDKLNIPNVAKVQPFHISTCSPKEQRSTMRERTRKIFVEAALAYFKRISETDVSKLSSQPNFFGVLEVQNYLFAELSRPCLTVKPDSEPKICFLEYVGKNASKKVSSNLSFRTADGAGSKWNILPDLIFNHRWFLYKTEPLSSTYFPLKQQSINFYYRCKNLFVLRNLNEEAVEVTVTNSGCSVIELSSSPQRALVDNRVLLESKGSAVLILKRRDEIPVHKNEFPTVFESAVGNILVFYLANVIA